MNSVTKCFRPIIVIIENIDAAGVALLRRFNPFLYVISSFLLFTNPVLILFLQRSFQPGSRISRYSQGNCSCGCVGAEQKAAFSPSSSPYVVAIDSAKYSIVWLRMGEYFSYFSQYERVFDYEKDYYLM